MPRRKLSPEELKEKWKRQIENLGYADSIGTNANGEELWEFGKYYLVYVELHPKDLQEKIVGDRTLKDGTVQYRIKWKNWPSSENSWEPAHALEIGELELHHYHERKHNANLRKIKQTSPSSDNGDPDRTDDAGATKLSIIIPPVTSSRRHEAVQVRSPTPTSSSSEEQSTYSDSGDEAQVKNFPIRKNQMRVNSSDEYCDSDIDSNPDNPMTSAPESSHRRKGKAFDPPLEKNSENLLSSPTTSGFDGPFMAEEVTLGQLSGLHTKRKLQNGSSALRRPDPNLFKRDEKPAGSKGSQKIKRLPIGQRFKPSIIARPVPNAQDDDDTPELAETLDTDEGALRNPNAFLGHGMLPSSGPSSPSSSQFSLDPLSVIDDDPIFQAFNVNNRIVAFLKQNALETAKFHFFPGKTDCSTRETIQIQSGLEQLVRLTHRFELSSELSHADIVILHPQELVELLRQTTSLRAQDLRPVFLLCGNDNLGRFLNMDILPHGGVATLTVQALSDSPELAVKRIREVTANPLWKVFLLPSAPGMAIRQYYSNRKLWKSLDESFAFADLLELINEGLVTVSLKENQAASENQEDEVRVLSATGLVKSCMKADPPGIDFDSPLAEIRQEISNALEALQIETEFFSNYRRFVLLTSDSDTVISNDCSIEVVSLQNFEFALNS